MTAAAEELNHLERQVNVSIPGEEIAQEISKRTKELMKTAKIDGFRPGKVPENIIKQRFAPNIEAEVLSKLMEKQIEKTMAEQQLAPVAYPEIKAEQPYQAGKPFDFTLVFEVFPDIVLQPLDNLVIEKTITQVTEEDAAKSLEGMQKQHTAWHEVELPAKNGDKVWIKFQGTINDVPFEGGQHDNMPVILGSGGTIPGFESGLLDTQKNQDITIDVTFPDNYGAKDLAGKPAKFAIHINKIEEPSLPALDDKFAERFGMTSEEGGMAKLREEVKNTLQKQVDLELRHKLKAQVMTRLYETYKTLPIPRALLRQEAKHLLDQAKKQFAQFKAANMPQFTSEMFEEKAKERVILGLVIRAMIKKDNIQPEASKIRALIESAAERFDDPEKAVQHYYHNENRLQEMESLALEEQIVDKILEEATLVEKHAKAAEILGKPEPQEEA